MIISYDQNPNLTVDQKLQSLIESIMLAINEKADNAEMLSTAKLLQAADKEANKSIEEIQATPHVIETGKEGIWTWRKWSDGTSECWGRSIKTTYNLSSSYGGLYYTTVAPFATFPSGLFLHSPVLTATRAQTVSGQGLIGISFYFFNKDGANAYIFDSTSGNKTDVQFCMHAIGRYIE